MTLHQLGMPAESIQRWAAWYGNGLGYLGFVAYAAARWGSMERYGLAPGDGRNPPPADAAPHEEALARVVCGSSHPDPEIDAALEGMREDLGAPPDSAGCGRAGAWTVMYRCVECGRWFHRDCARRHFAAHGAAPRPSGDAPSETPWCDAWLAVQASATGEAIARLRAAREHLEVVLDRLRAEASGAPPQ